MKVRGKPLEMEVGFPVSALCLPISRRVLRAWVEGAFVGTRIGPQGRAVTRAAGVRANRFVLVL